MSGFENIVELSHEKALEFIGTGDIVIDATIGNGYDTCFLAESVGAEGHVFGFDLQKQAIVSTRSLMQHAGMLDRLTLFHAGHEKMHTLLPRKYHQKIKGVFFNLGYLPGSNKSIVTNPESTIKALELAWQLIAIKGIISVVYYTAHRGGLAEAIAVKAWVKNKADGQQKNIYLDYPKSFNNGPGIVVIAKSQ